MDDAAVGFGNCDSGCELGFVASSLGYRTSVSLFRLPSLAIYSAMVSGKTDLSTSTWALALGTPVLVVAGFGHLLTLVVLQFYHKAKGTNKEEPEREATTGGEGRDMSLR